MVDASRRIHAGMFCLSPQGKHKYGSRPIQKNKPYQPVISAAVRQLVDTQPTAVHGPFASKPSPAVNHDITKMLRIS